MKKKLLLSIIGAGIFALASCSMNQEPYRDILTPSGAPALSLVELSDEYPVTTSSASSIIPEFEKDNYGAIIFDFYNGLKLINKSEGRSHYRLWRIITGGNLYIVGLGADKEEPTEGSKVVSFQQGLLPDLVFKKVYENVNYSIEYVTENSQLAGVIATGTYNSQEVDYVVAPEPVLSNGLLRRQAAGLSYHTPISLAEKWGAPIPQAGLFINYEYFYKKYTSSIHEFYKDFDENIKALTTKIEGSDDYPTDSVVSFMNSHWSTAQEQTNRWGFDSSTIERVHKYNGLALLHDGTISDIDLQDFYTRLNKASEYQTVSQFIIDPSIIING